MEAYADGKRVIEDSISSHFDGMYLSRECLTEVMEKYGTERVADVCGASGKPLPRPTYWLHWQCRQLHRAAV